MTGRTIALVEAVGLREAYLKVAAEYGLDGVDMSHQDLQGIDLAGASMRGANLASANLGGGVLSYANLERARLHGADLNVEAVHTEFCGTDLASAETRLARLDPEDRAKVEGDRPVEDIGLSIGE